MFKYQEDRWPVAIILGFTVLDFIVFFSVNNLTFFICYWLIMIVPKGIISPWNHHHQHVLTFKSNVLNRLLEIIYALHTGVTTNLWVLHHNIGHHVLFLDQKADPSRWKRDNGKTMGELEYSLVTAATAYYRGYLMGKQNPKLQKQFLTFTAITFILVAALTIYKPAAALFVFILPMIGSLTFTAWVTYDHHAGLDTDDIFSASYNNLDPLFNLLSGNLGYHTAHHYKQGVHWSQLPELHEKIKHKIPNHLYRDSIFIQFLNYLGIKKLIRV
ncbi:MAG: fatty acid desaturase [Gammaproteobacteria bacterium]|nr:fatty acid desaturase [Gammaproteobacteria bacterium]